MSNPDIKSNLEDFIDQTSASYVLSLIKEICEEKAEHVRLCWQDEALAKEWFKASKAVETAENKVFGL